MTWTKSCPLNRDGYPCEGGYCHACECCDRHCDCANTDEVRHVAGGFVQGIGHA